MYIRLISLLGPNKNKWERIRHAQWYNEFVKTGHHVLYEIRPQPPQTPKQIQALKKGQIIRALKCAQAQLSIAKQLLKDHPDSVVGSTSTLVLLSGIPETLKTAIKWAEEKQANSKTPA